MLNRFWKTVAAVMAVALSVTLLPGQGRCDDMPRASVIMMVIELTHPKKPECAKPVAQPLSPCCPGAAAMPCCPMAHTTTVPCQGPSTTCTVCPVSKPVIIGGMKCVSDKGVCPTCPMCPHFQVETVPAPCCMKACCVKACCEQTGCCQAEHVLAEMRAHFAEQARMLHDLQTQIKDLRTAVVALQGQIQTLQASQSGVPVRCKVPVQSGTFTPDLGVPVEYKVPVQGGGSNLPGIPQ
jgi:hypothetical protein